MGLMELSLPGASHFDFSRLNELTSPRSVSVTLAKAPEQDKAVKAESESPRLGVFVH